MDISRSRLSATAITLIVGGAWLLVFASDGVSPCLGGPGLSRVACIVAHPPTVGLGPPAIAVFIATSLLISLPWPRTRWDLLWAPAGVALGAAAYLQTRPLVLDLTDSDGAVARLPLAAEPWGLIFGGIAGCFGFLVLGSLVVIVVRRWGLG
jgi:hypothetical protein